MQPFNVLLFLSFLGFSFYGNAAVVATDSDAAASTFTSPAAAFNYGFKPEDFQALKGERHYEENVLRYLQKLEAHLASATSPIHENLEFINLRGHIANGYLSLLDYAVLLKNLFHPIRKLNTLESITHQKHVKKAIDQIYETTPILRDSIGEVYNYESERWDFKHEVYIGRNPFFDPLSILLTILYNPKSTIDQMKTGVERIGNTLRKRYHYYRFIKPLQTVSAHVQEIIDAPTVEEVPFRLQKLKDMIYHDILYRYNLIDDSPPVIFPKPLKDGRQQIPWGLLSTIGAAAHWFIYAGSDPTSTHGVLYESISDIRADLDNLLGSLQFLVSMEQAFYCGATLPTMIKPTYPHIRLLANWYVTHTGFGMLRAHTAALVDIWRKYDEPMHILPELPILLSCAPSTPTTQWKAGTLKEKHAYLKTLRRPLNLHYMLMGGEISNRLYKILKSEEADDPLSNLLLEWYKLRNKIAHPSQKRDLDAFEASLNMVPNTDWEAFINAYLAVNVVIEEPQGALSGLRWMDIKRSPRLRVIFTDNEATRHIFHQFYIQLFKLNHFIEHGIWRGPEETPEAIFKTSFIKFQSTLKEAHRKTITAELLLDPKTDKRQNCLKRLGKLNEAQLAMWNDLCEKADALKTPKVSVPKPKESKNATLVHNLKELVKHLHKLIEIKTTETSRHLSPVEGSLLEYYLILLRNSSNYVVDHLEEHIDFSVHSPQTLAQLNATIKLTTGLQTLTASVTNPKAHLHRFSEPHSNEVSAQGLNRILYRIPELLEDAQTVLSILEAPSEKHMGSAEVGASHIAPIISKSAGAAAI